MSNKLKFIGGVLFLGWILNFVLFWIVAFAIGGDAINGKAEGGRYFLASHGKLTEVPEDVYTYSYWHTLGTALTLPAAIVGWLLLTQRRPTKLGGWL